jgi:hypothetical protein
MLREDLRLKVFAKRVLRKISELKRDVVTGEWIMIRYMTSTPH